MLLLNLDVLSALKFSESTSENAFDTEIPEQELHLLISQPENMNNEVASQPKFYSLYSLMKNFLNYLITFFGIRWNKKHFDTFY